MTCHLPRGRCSDVASCFMQYQVVLPLYAYVVAKEAYAMLSGVAQSVALCVYGHAHIGNPGLVLPITLCNAI